MKDSPSARAQRSMNHVGASAHASVCASGGTRGPGGSEPFGPLSGRSEGPDRGVGSSESVSGAPLPALAGLSADGLVIAMDTRYRRAARGAGRRAQRPAPAAVLVRAGGFGCCWAGAWLELGLAGRATFAACFAGAGCLGRAWREVSWSITLPTACLTLWAA
ncbi:MAG TPA: hypothetical protein VNZ05_04005 [Solirubrobacteraceae bacterium]|nr:hypothetical protein [Solirubrobacteraceae bacterium]